MAFLKVAISTLSHLRKTVHARYGGGMRGYANFFYFSLLRINTFIIFIHGHDGELSCLPRSDQLEFVRNDHERLDELRRSRELPREFYCAQAHDACDFVLGSWEGEAAYIHWIFHQNGRTRFLNLGRGCAEIGSIVTLPEFRGRRICSHALAYTVQTLYAEGVQRIYCVVHDNNIASIKAVERVGFRQFRKARAIGPFNKRHDVVA